MSDRIAKVNELFKQEVGKIILRDVDFSADMIVTVIKADVSADLHYADIYVSVMPHKRGMEAIALLEENIYDIQQKINRKLFMKPVPKIRFRLDLSGERADRINEIIRKNKENDR